MGEVVLVRHAQASFGAADYDRLSELGWRQTDWLGHYFRAHDLRFDAVLRGSLRRHRETAEGLLRHEVGPPAREDARFDEFHYFGLQQEYQRETGTAAAVQSRRDFLQTFPEVFEGWAAGRLGREGESFAAFRGRVTAALAEATRPGATTLVVSSGGVIGVILGAVLGLAPRATADLALNIHNASVHRLTHEAGRLRLSLFNASPHLDPADRVHARTYV